jgi:hypothetical protein
MGKPDKVRVFADCDTLLRDLDFGAFIAVFAEGELHWFHLVASLVEQLTKNLPSSLRVVSL